MNVTQIKTRKFLPPKDSLDDLIAEIPKLKDKSIIAISSKVISIIEGNTRSIGSVNHDELVKKLSDSTLQPVKMSNTGLVLTQVGNILVESAGIDTSNANGYYVLLPKDPYKSAKIIWSRLRKRDKIKHFGVVITDSHAVPRRKGAMGFALACYGFKSTHMYKDKHDIFGKNFKLVASDVSDSVAAAAVLAMGEGNEMTPIASITGLENIDFFNRAVPLGTAKRYSWVHPSLDVYTPLLKDSLWEK